MYFARGFCKNGSTCKFLHSDVDPIDVGSPNKTGSAFDELLRMKALQNQRFAFMASGGHHPFAYNKCMDILNENPRCDLSPMGFGAGASSSSRQIYLTFPADSTFKEEDVSNYFRKQQQQHLERGEYSACLSPSGVDSREPFDHLPFDACQEAVDEKFATERTESFGNNRANADDSVLEESFEHILPDNLFASPTKLAAENQSVFSQASAPADDTTHVTITSSNNTPVLPTGSPLTIASLKSCYFQMPRYRPPSIVTVSLLSPFKQFTYTTIINFQVFIWARSHRNVAVSANPG
ncbi:UNVERIFIED_CONTAM: Zinc finger CCCH domain-containing protein 55 [Sesamum angustifolium]|uniref:Zinc finger CCCH domain-containing protein 55 n=1 Tax=Sesamum angustifolium TaxID=2727405 RepID=A0AAW2IZN8_9LAMI